MNKITFLFSFVFLAFLVLVDCKSKTVVRKIPTKANRPVKSLNGVPYRLPRTVVSITVPVKLTKTKPGPFVEFQPCFFPDEKEIVKKENREIQIQTPTFDSFGEPDPKESYVVSIKGGIFENKSLLMEFSPRGVLKKGEATSEDKSLEFALKTVQTVTSIGSSIVGAKLLKDLGEPADLALKKQATECYKLMAKKAKERVEKEAGKNKEVAEKYQEAAEKIESKDLESKGAEVQAEAQSVFDCFLRANEAFAKLTELLKRRDNMISSPSDASADSFKLRLAETDKSIEAYRQLFLGITSESVWNAVFQIRPGETATQYTKPLLVFIAKGFSEDNTSDNAGVCADLGLVKEDGVQPPPKFRGNNCLAPRDRELTAVWLKLEKDMEDADYLNKIKVVSQTYTDKKKERGWYFRIAAKGNLYVRQATVMLSNVINNNYMDSNELNGKSRELTRTNMPIAQMGVVASIPASGAGRSQQSALELNGITGELVNFKYSSAAALEKERLSEIQSSAENIIKANDPLEKKKRELEKLKTEKEIRDLNANLNPQP